MDDQTQLQPWLASSVDATKVSARVSGIILALSSFLIGTGAVAFHITLSTADITQLASAVGMVCGGIYFLYGLLRFFALKVGSVKQ